MSADWDYRPVPIKFQLSDRTIFATTLWLQARAADVDEAMSPVADPSPPAESLQVGSEGFLIRSLPVISPLPSFRHKNGYFCYVPSQYRRYYIDLQQSFTAYKNQFSSKTRSTINRKMRKYAEHCGGQIQWHVYDAPHQMSEFFRHACAVSAKSYQERLFGAGLPDSEDFRRHSETLAAEGNVRAFVLFDRARPVSYLYCPARDGVISYQYVGYDPEYMKFSVGTVLQWLALEHLFSERRYRLFDFTEGQSEHKRMFSTHDVLCANVLFVRATIRNAILLQSHRLINALSKQIGRMLEWIGIKARIRKLLRFGA